MVKKVNQCRICHNKDLIDIIDLGEQCIASRFPSMGEPDPIEAPLKLIKCNDESDSSHCGLIQLAHNVDPGILYSDHYGYRSGINSTMPKHLKGLVREIEERIHLENNDIILDVGSNDSTLLKSYSKEAKLRRIGIDPTGLQFKEYYPEDVTLVPTYFSKDAFCEKFNDEKARVVTTISMFYDLPDPIAFTRDIKSILAEDGIWVTEQSYCVTMLEKNSFDTICHEHLEYYTLKQIQFIADAVGMKIVDISLNECNGGSFRITLAHNDSDIPINHAAIQSIKEKEDALSLHTCEVLHEFFKRCNSMKEELVRFLTEQKLAGKSIYIYGASTKGNTLLQYYGLDNFVITAAAERNPRKYGHRTPKTNIPIIPEKEMREAPPDFLLVLPWHFKDEFIEREKAYLDYGGALIFPLPTLTIYSTSKKKL